MPARSFLLSTILLVGLLPRLSSAQPTLQGVVSGSLGPGAYIVVGDCQVEAGTTLTIQPGTTFLFSGHYYFLCYGQLQALGTESDSIKFVRQYPTNEYKHGGLRFFPESSGSAISYCLIDQARNDTTLNFYFGGGIWVSEATIHVAHSTLSNNFAWLFGGGIYLSHSGGSHIEDCRIYNNRSDAKSGGGIYAEYCYGLVIKNCLIQGNSSGGT